MKKMKKFLAMMLAMAMVLGMSLTTFAAGATATITVNNAGSSATFKYLQVIKADPTKETGWAFVNADVEKNYTDAFSGKSAQEVIKAMIEGNVDSQIAAALSNVQNGRYTLVEASANPFTVDAAGVYFVEGLEDDYNYTPMAAYVSFGSYVNGVPTDLEDATVEAKRSTTVVGKTSDQENAVTEIGRNVTYTISSVMPYIPTTNSNRNYVVSDTITGASYVTVADGDNAGKVAVTLTIGSTVNTTVYADVTNNSFRLDLSSYLANNTYANQNVTLSYEATVTDVTVGNTVSIGNGTNDGTSVYGSDTETLYTGSITLTKYASDGDNDDLSNNAKLAGAGFKVSAVKDGTTVYATVADGKLTGWVDTEAAATEVVTGADGTLTIAGLADGTYTFKEVTAPTGYSINTTDTVVTLEKGKLNAESKVTAAFTGTGFMIDDTLSALPSTGGIGTTIFTIGGCAIMIIAAGLYFSLRRKTAK